MKPNVTQISDKTVVFMQSNVLSIVLWCLRPQSIHLSTTHWYRYDSWFVYDERFNQGCSMFITSLSACIVSLSLPFILSLSCSPPLLPTLSPPLLLPALPALTSLSPPLSLLRPPPSLPPSSPSPSLPPISPPSPPLSLPLSLSLAATLYQSCQDSAARYHHKTLAK